MIIASNHSLEIGKIYRDGKLSGSDCVYRAVRAMLVIRAASRDEWKKSVIENNPNHSHFSHFPYYYLVSMD